MKPIYVYKAVGHWRFVCRVVTHQLFPTGYNCVDTYEWFSHLYSSHDQALNAGLVHLNQHVQKGCGG